MTRCRDFRELVSMGLDGVLTPEELSSLETHLAGCSQCRDFQKDLVQVRDQIKALDTVEPPPWLAERVMVRVQARPTFWRRVVVPLVMRPRYQAASLLLLVATGYLLLRDGRPSFTSPRIPEAKGDGEARPAVEASKRAEFSAKEEKAKVLSKPSASGQLLKAREEMTMETVPPKENIAKQAMPTTPPAATPPPSPTPPLNVNQAAPVNAHQEVTLNATQAAAINANPQVNQVTPSSQNAHMNVGFQQTQAGGASQASQARAAEEKAGQRISGELRSDPIRGYAEAEATRDKAEAQERSRKGASKAAKPSDTTAAPEPKAKESKKAAPAPPVHHLLRLKVDRPEDAGRLLGELLKAEGGQILEGPDQRDGRSLVVRLDSSRLPSLFKGLLKVGHVVESPPLAVDPPRSLTLLLRW